MKKYARDGMVNFTLRIPQELADKLSAIGEYHGRTRSGEILWALRRYVEAFERHKQDFFEDAEKPDANR